MVKLEHVNKYFYKRRKNQIHVINDTSLEMGSYGLVALLGPSGCGKTTLLNVIGGLDKVGSGKVFINGQKLTRRTAGKIDKIRNLNVGYIFQNYNLVDNMTVFENVAIALRMVGVKDKKEIEEKVNYVLEKVGMYRYRNRYADMLSGGERQRVGIARAIVKNPAIIIADEPTGNLDSRNTLEVMNIIKAISEDKLVILVTHEEELAKFYASRIIRIKDGKMVSDELNDHVDDLDYRIENKIYLRDIRQHHRLVRDGYNIDFYNDTDSDISLDVVLKNGCLYIRTKDGKIRTEFADEDSGVELVDDNYKTLSREESMANAIDMAKLAHNGRRKYKSIINPFKMIKDGFKKVMNYHILKKILLVGFLIAAMFITYAVSSIYGVLDITDDEFITKDKSYITIVGKKIPVSEYLDYEANEGFDYIIPGDGNVALSMTYKDYYQTKDSFAAISGCLSDSGKLEDSDITKGRLPENSTEIAIDKLTLEKVIENYQTKTAGFAKPADFLDKNVKVSNMPEMTIVGIVDRESPCIYMNRSIFINVLANMKDEDEMYDMDEEISSEGEMIDYALKKKSFKLVKGEWPDKNYEVVVSENNKEEMKIGKTINKKVNGKKLTVTGYYSDPYGSDVMLVNNNMVKYNLIKKSENITVCPIDKEASLQQLRDEDVNVKDVYEESREEYRNSIWDSVVSSLVMAGVVLVISFIEIFLIMRASFLSRIKEVGVYRAIGVKKSDIYKMFTGEILAITTIASMPGFAFMAYILHKLSAMQWFEDSFMINAPVLILCVVLIYGINLLFGLFPVFRVVRKRPAAILSRTDIN